MNDGRKLEYVEVRGSPVVKSVYTKQRTSKEWSTFSVLMEYTITELPKLHTCYVTVTTPHVLAV